MVTLGEAEPRDSFAPVRPHGCSQACSILLLVLCFLDQVELQSPFGEEEVCRKMQAIISVLREWETKLGDWQISWQGRDV